MPKTLTPKLGYSIEQTHRNVTTVRMKDIRGGWEQWFLLCADRHWDNPKSDHAMQRRHLNEAMDRRAGIIEPGDVFCAMGGKWDPRSDKSGVRPEHQRGNYLDRIVEDCAKFLSPYAGNYVMIGPGNHETGILKRHETDLTGRLVERMHALTGNRPPVGGYSGWIRFMFTAHGARRDSRTMYYHHGFGGGGPVTRGTIQTARMAVFLPDADFVITGHTHDEWQLPIQRSRISERGVPYQDEQFHLRIPSYKDSWSDGFGGWEVERGMAPRPKGAVWLRFYVVGDEIRSEVTRAK